ncbi:MAG TPA: lipid A-modifier LpxR family protein [Saprospiraceae bacterium]|nr:lipid A-modifier LpxR family protein [Saprospiraceae bacterium]
MKAPYVAIAWLFLAFALLPLSAQESGGPRLEFVEYTTENDYYFLRLPSDRYYTAGQSIRLNDQSLDKGRLSPASLFPLRFVNRQAENLSQLCLRYQLFTPFRIHWNTPEQIDRPYTARLDLQFENQTFLPENGLKLYKSLLLGFQGPSMRGENIQNGVHRLKGRPLAQGWEYQLADRPYWVVQFQAEKAISTGAKHLWLASPQIYLGNVQQYVQMGMHYKNGDLAGYFRPNQSMPSIHWHTYFHFSARYVHRNQLLNGTMRPNSDIKSFQPPHTKKLVYLASYGIQFTWKRWAIRLSQEAMSPEFEGGSSHFWGSISLRKYY